MSSRTLTFIGGGNMARSLIGGLLESFNADTIRVSDPLSDIRQGLERDFGVFTTDDNVEAISGSSCVVLAVKPQMMKSVLTSIADPIQSGSPLVISIAAGIRIASISDWLSGYDNVVRVMPNTPALVKRGASGLFASDKVSADDRALAEEVMRAVGIAQWVNAEDMLDVVTALSGSGPAYFFYLLEVMADTATKMGLDAKASRELALETAIGAALLAAESPETFKKLRQNVTSPGGTTEAAINAMEAAQGREVISGALTAARRRSTELADQLGS